MDVSHLNLHKTFCIPHGGGGPGMGPIWCEKHWHRSYPGHSVVEQEMLTDQGAVSAAPFGSASILPISWMYARMMTLCLRKASQVAILNANYIVKRLSGRYDIFIYRCKGYKAHECIVDLRPIKRDTGISELDIASAY